MEDLGTILDPYLGSGALTASTDCLQGFQQNSHKFIILRFLTAMDR